MICPVFRYLFTLMIALSVIIIPEPLSAFDPEKPLTQSMLTFWNKKDGLPQNSANVVLQSREGYLWIGTQEGLVRFDGVSFVLFDKKNTGAIKNNFISALAEDSTGTMWIGTWGGLVKLDKGEFSFLGEQQGLTNEAVLALWVDGSRLWIGTDGRGLFIYEKGQFKNYTVSDGLSGNNIQALCGGPGGVLWIGTNGNGLNRFDGRHFQTYSISDGLTHNTIRALLYDHTGQLIIGTWGGGLNRFDGKRFTRELSVASSALITSVFSDSHRSLWVGTDAHGVYRLNKTRTETLTVKDGLPLNVIMSVCEDREGNIWIGTGGGGLGKISDCSFSSYTTRKGLPHNMIWSVFEDPGKNLWIGTDGGGIAKMKNDNITIYTTRDGLSHNVVTAIFRDKKGDMWFGTRVEGLNRFSGGRFTPYPDISAVSSKTIRSLAEDHDGYFWVGTQNGLVQTRDGQVKAVFNTSNKLPSNIIRTLCVTRDSSLWIGTNGGVHRYRNGVVQTWNQDQGLKSNIVVCFYEDSSRALWIGTWGGGLNRFKNGAITSVTTAQGLYDDGIFSILEDNRGQLWMSSNNGVFRASLKDLNDAADGKINSVSCAVFGEAEGMNSAECNAGQPSGFKASDGRLWFPTIQGAAVVDPDRIIDNPYPPPVIIERAVVDGKLFNQRVEDENLFEAGSSRYEFHYTGLSYLAPEKVKFRYRLNGFDRDWIDAGSRRTAYYTNIPYGHYTFEVVACNNSGVWNTVPSRFSFYQNPYVYQTWTFYVVVGFIIAGLVFSVFRYRVRQFDKRQKELEDLVRIKTRLVETQKSELVDALDNLKTTQMQLVQSAKMSSLGQLVAGMAHEINNPITVINGYLPLISMLLNDLKNAAQSPEPAKVTVKIFAEADAILKSCSDAVERIKKIIANLRSFSRLDEADYKLGDLHENLESTLTLFLPNYEPKIRVEKHYADIPPFYFYPGQLNQVFMNVLINAAEAITDRNVKESREQGVIEITTELINNLEQGRSIRVVFSDDGIGIPDSIRDKIFDPFFTTKSVGSGMGLGLSISYGIMQKHRGSIAVSSGHAGGTVVVLELPM